jgi:hypothetical protein
MPDLDLNRNPSSVERLQARQHRSADPRQVIVYSQVSIHSDLHDSLNLSLNLDECCQCILLFDYCENSLSCGDMELDSGRMQLPREYPDDYNVFVTVIRVPGCELSPGCVQCETFVTVS